ncbi:hypothetical protein PACTADRAFT_16669 [Pachysolen tannophilus NRRL Y-2460]|uniref:Cytochrome b mRNA-processing protein 4 n=1 Tax=Pachysolen tannophilus NRRL Y-2460 TaxID=669874 RepID=A0A1E4TTR3_PACTA|nr:hypothetical protein PACTADRAFT_16669 [Pachysolen tannophilus NRRL Y-2460]
MRFENKLIFNMSASQTYLLWKRSLIACGSIIGTGVLLYKFTTPSEEQFLASLSPELKAEYEKNKDLRRKEQEELMKIVKQTSSSDNPVWYTGSLVSPWEKNPDGTKRESLLVAKEKYEKEQAAIKQREAIAKSKLELEENEKLELQVKQKSKGWLPWNK